MWDFSTDPEFQAKLEELYRRVNLPDLLKLLDLEKVAKASLPDNGAKSVGISGGVSANSRLRKDALARGEAEQLPVLIPRLSLSTDNAAMIAAAGLRVLERGGPSSLDFNAHATLRLGPAATHITG